MKLSVAFYVSTLASAAANPMPIFGKMKAGKTKSISGDLTADSVLGNRVLSKARRLDEDEADFSWVSGYSLKFQGCFHVSQWNAEADGEEDVRIMTKRLVRFRLCPASSCDTGCSSGYGDYIIDMNTYVDAYLESKEELERQECEYLEENVCDCEEKDDDQFDEEQCMSDCYSDNNMDYCAEDEEDAFQLNDYMECGQFEIPDDDDGNRRRLEEEEEEVQYFIGPYCANQGGAVYLGMFTDDTCSEYADNYGGASTYKSFVGSKLPYSSKNIIGSECVSCLMAKEERDDDQAEEEEDEVSEVCDMLYQASGKCESNLDIDDPNENGCTFMEGIKIIRKSGIVSTEAPAPSKTASAFIGIFAFSTCLLAGYVYFLKSKMVKSKINLASS